MKVILLITIFVTQHLAASTQVKETISHGRLLQNKTSTGVIYQIGVYKVQGSPHLTDVFSDGDFFSTSETAKNIELRYNVYNQEVDFISSSNKNQALVKEVGELDSFVLRIKGKKNEVQVQSFIYAGHLGIKEEVYYQCLFKGPKYSIYKKYLCDLVIPSANGPGDIREFKISFEYWYINESTKEKKKINNTAGAIKKELGHIKDLSEVMKGSGMFKNLDKTFIQVFAYLNE